MNDLTAVKINNSGLCFCYTFPGSRSAVGDECSLPQAPINWVAVFALVVLPIVAVIAIPLYAYHHDFSLAAWISMFVLLGVSSLGITAGYHRLWAHRAYEATLPLKSF